MKFPYRVKVDGIYYPANTEIPCAKAEKKQEEIKTEEIAVEETVVEEKADKPKKTTKKK